MNCLCQNCLCRDCQCWIFGDGVLELIEIQNQSVRDSCFTPLIKYTEIPVKGVSVYSGFIFNCITHISSIISSVISIIYPANIAMTLLFLIISVVFDLVSVYCNRYSLSLIRSHFLKGDSNTWWNRCGNTLFWPILGVLSCIILAFFGQLNPTTKMGQFFLVSASLISDLIISSDNLVKSTELDKLLKLSSQQSYSI